MPHFKLTLSYDGTRFAGWQRQDNGPSIQAALEDALSLLDGRPVAVAGAGRTDAGVHALGQVAAATLERDIASETLVRALNANLPADVRVVAAQVVEPSFHPRFDATAKTYRYRIWNGSVLPPFERPYVWHWPAPALEAEAMDGAARILEGTHDFAAFQGSGAQTHTSRRTITMSRVRRVPLAGVLAGLTPGQDAALLEYEVAGNGFLRYMVRSIVGTLIEVGRGRRPPSWMASVLASRDRARAGETAPPCGLFLVGVAYQSPDL